MKISLKAARVNAGLKQKDAAEKLGISRDTLRKYELGEIPMRIDTAKKVCEIYEIPENYIKFF